MCDSLNSALNFALFGFPGDSSVVCYGVADWTIAENRYPGRTRDSVGYHSREGQLYFNDKDNGNTKGRRFGKGLYVSFLLAKNDP